MSTLKTDTAVDGGVSVAHAGAGGSNSDVAMLAEQVRLLTDRVTQIPGVISKDDVPQVPEEQDVYDRIAEDFSPANKIVRGLKWAAAIVIPIFMAGGAYYKFRDDVAMKADIQRHVAEDLQPVRDKVDTIEKGMHTLKSGVNTLVSEKKHEREIRKLERQLHKHSVQYEQEMADYRSLGSRRGGVRRPTKSSEHLRLESMLEEVLERPISATHDLYQK